MNAAEQTLEIARCFDSPVYFIGTYCKIYDATTGEWVPFDLWPEQKDTLLTIFVNLLVIILKARQLGLTWLVLGFSLWLVIFRPAATVLLFSKRDDEAVYLLDERLKGMWERLPDELKYGLQVVEDNDHTWALSNGSSIRAFPTTAGDSYTATLAIVDEADLVPNLNKLMRAVKPTIDAGGRMILLSRSDKKRPQSEFKRIYRAAKRKLSPWVAVFLPWFIRPGRDEQWYQEQRADILTRTTALDDLYEQYPATDTEALAPATKDKRIPGIWLEQCYKERDPMKHTGDAPAIDGLEIYAMPETGHRYVIGGDPAEGNPTSDDSALTVLDEITGEEMAALAGKYQPSVLGSHIDSIGVFYNMAQVMVERNNHGHAVILWLDDNSTLALLKGHDDKVGWMSSSKGKAILYDACADVFKDQDTTLHSFDTYTQLASIEGATLRAPEGERDDRADSYALAHVARLTSGPQPAGELVNDIPTEAYKAERHSIWR